jgi:predicted PhzF superfamily epimerase YddE/YHI9
MRITQVDAFTDRPFAGNPAAVCVLSAPRPEPWMQAVAREMNLSETAFLHRESADEAERETSYRLRWFTPAIEVDLCGHATLASAHVLWEEGHLAAGELARFETRSGHLSAWRDGDWILMDFPAEPAGETPAPDEVVQALGVRPVFTGKNRFDWLVEVASEEEMRRAAPDFGKLGAATERGVILTCRADGGNRDFLSRFFAPAVGIDEDPVTGSAHCCLGPYWAERLGKPALVGYQASARGGVVRVEVKGERVQLGGQAVTVLRSELLG